MRTLIFGDSISQGYYDLAIGGWANMLLLDTLKHKVRNVDNTSEVFNVSVSGDDISRVIVRLANEIEVRKWEDEPILLVFSIGFNDTRIENDKPYSTLDDFKKDLGALYEIAAQFSNNMIFVGLTSVYEPESAPWKFNAGNDDISWTNERIRLFDGALKDFANENNAAFVSLLDTFLEHQKDKNLHADGIHPNEYGHKLIYNAVKPVVEKFTLRS